MTSEFGQTVTPSDRAGSDHGHAGQHFIMGGSVNGGKILNRFIEDPDPLEAWIDYMYMRRYRVKALCLPRWRI